MKKVLMLILAGTVLGSGVAFGMESEENNFIENKNDECKKSPLQQAKKRWKYLRPSCVLMKKNLK
jgi:hypothetical protein